MPRSIRHHRRTVAVAVAVAALTALGGCGGGSTVGGPASTTVDDGSAAAAIVLPDANDVLDDGVTLESASRAALDELLVSTGLGTVVPGAAATIATLEAEVATEWLGGRRAPAPAFGRSRPGAPATPGGGGQGADAASLGVGVLFALVSQALSDAEGRPEPDADREPVDPAQNHLTVEGSTIDALVAEQRSQDGITLDTSVRARLVACPDAGGVVEATLSATTKISTGDPSGASAGLSYEIEVDLRATLNDDAGLAGFEMTVAGAASGFGRDVRGDERDAAGYFIEGGSSTTYTGSVRAGDLRAVSVTGPGITRASSSVGAAQEQAFIDHQFQIGQLLSNLVLADLENLWRSGACVEVILQPDGDPMALAASETIEVRIDARSKEDGTSIDGRATTAVTSGPVVVAPGETTVPDPAVVTITMGDPSGSAGVTVEVRSRRGIGTASLDLGGSTGWTADGQLDVFSASGTTCEGLAGEWTLDLTADFDGARFTGTLALDLGAGTFVLTGTTTGGGISIPQQGGGTVEVVEHADGTATLALSGAAWAGGPAGTRELPLRPATTC